MLPTLTPCMQGLPEHTREACELVAATLLALGHAASVPPAPCSSVACGGSDAGAANASDSTRAGFETAAAAAAAAGIAAMQQQLTQARSAHESLQVRCDELSQRLRSSQSAMEAQARELQQAKTATDGQRVQLEGMREAAGQVQQQLASSHKAASDSSWSMPWQRRNRCSGSAQAASRQLPSCRRRLPAIMKKLGSCGSS
jgi:hypothetical protein